MPGTRIHPGPAPHLIADDAHDQAPTIVGLGRGAAMALWSSGTILQILCVGYFASTAWFYCVFPSLSVAQSLAMYALILDLRYFPLLGLGHGLIAAGHVLALGYDQLALCRALPRGRQRRPRADPATATPVPSWKMLLKSIQATIKTLYTQTMGRKSPFSVTSPYFDLAFFIREIFELALQTFQASQMARLVVHPRIVHAYVSLIVFNCLATPLLHATLDRNPPLRRLASILLDIFIDFASVVFVPVHLVLEFAADFDREHLDFFTDAWYQDAFLVRVLHHTQLILFASWWDVLARAVFSLSLLNNLITVKRLVDNSVAAANSKTTSTPSQASVHQAPCGILQRAQSLVHRLSTSILLLWGICLLSVHLDATFRVQHAPSCRLRLQPWLSLKPACALVVVRCLDSRPHPLDALLSPLDQSTLAFVTIEHCSHLVVSPIVRQFHRLVGIKIYNSTVERWTTEAALSQSTHPSLRLLYMIRTDFADGRLPTGLLDPTFPRTLLDLEVCVSNLRELPPDLDQLWPREMFLYLEGADLAAASLLPLARMSLRVLSLAQSDVRAIPQRLITDPTIFFLDLSRNPIVELPSFLNWSERAGSVYALVLDITWTNISTLPVTILNGLAQQQLYVNARGTLLCSEPAGVPIDGIDCDVGDPEWLGMYPLALEDEWRREKGGSDD